KDLLTHGSPHELRTIQYSVPSSTPQPATEIIWLMKDEEFPPSSSLDRSQIHNLPLSRGCNFLSRGIPRRWYTFRIGTGAAVSPAGSTVLGNVLVSGGAGIIDSISVSPIPALGQFRDIQVFMRTRIAEPSPSTPAARASDLCPLIPADASSRTRAIDRAPPLLPDAGKVARKRLVAALPCLEVGDGGVHRGHEQPRQEPEGERGEVAPSHDDRRFSWPPSPSPLETVAGKGARRAGWDYSGPLSGGAEGSEVAKGPCRRRRHWGRWGGRRKQPPRLGSLQHQSKKVAEANSKEYGVSISTLLFQSQIVVPSFSIFICTGHNPKPATLSLKDIKSHPFILMYHVFLTQGSPQEFRTIQYSVPFSIPQPATETIWFIIGKTLNSSYRPPVGCNFLSRGIPRRWYTFRIGGDKHSNRTTTYLLEHWCCREPSKSHSIGECAGFEWHS
ncbi:hypothetical protein E2320_009583, partial [Naja naja]